LHSGAAG